MSSSKKKKHRKRNRFASFFLTLGIIACVGVIGFSAYKLVTTWMEYREGDEEYDRLREYTEAVKEEEPEKPEEPEEKEPEKVVAEVSENGLDNLFTRRKPPIDVNWKSLKKINQDIVGWLYIGAVDISYPIVQGKDDDYYLHRTFERKDNFAGAIFVEAENKGDFTDPNTIVYGHNMLNGSMFGKLSDLTKKDDEKYKKDPYFWILTPRGNYRYRMISIHVTGVTSEVYTLFDGVDETFPEWCREMQERSYVMIQDETFTVFSRIVTLSTCTGDSSTRYVVQGQAVKD